MSESAARIAVIVAATLTVVLETSAVALSFGAGSLGQASIYAVYAVVQVLAGAAVVWRHPHHRVGWLLVVSSVFNATFSDALLAYGRQAALHAWPAAAPAQVVALSGWMVAGLGLVLLFLWFPDGRVSGPARWIPWVWALGALVGLPGWALNPRLGPEFIGHVNPYAANATWTEVLFLCGTALVVAALLASVVVFVLRFRRSEGVEHLQLKWMAFAATVVAVVLPVSTVLWTVWPPVQLLAAAALTLLPVATSWQSCATTSTTSTSSSAAPLPTPRSPACWRRRTPRSSSSRGRPCPHRWRPPSVRSSSRSRSGRSATGSRRPSTADSGALVTRPAG